MDFTSGIQIIQENTANTFYKSQGGMFTSKKIKLIFDHINDQGIKGFGQSSWGPTGFIFCENAKHQNFILQTLNNFIEIHSFNNIEIVTVEGRNKGAFQL